MVLERSYGVLWPRVLEWYLNVFFNDILDSLYRSMVLNGIFITVESTTESWWNIFEWSNGTE